MESTLKKTIRSNYRSPLGARKHNTEWAQLKEALDQLGPQRSVDQWKICWRDQKRKARVEGGALSQAQNATGNVVEIPSVSENSELVLGAIGQEMAVGMGPKESPIGNNQVEIEVIREIEPKKRHILPRQRPAAMRRARRIVPADRFLEAQLELNGLIRELITEVRRSNNLKQEKLNYLCGKLTQTLQTEEE